MQERERAKTHEALERAPKTNLAVAFIINESTRLLCYIYMKNAYCTLNTIWHKATTDSQKVTVGSKRLSMHVISIVLLKLVSYPEQK